MLDRIDHQMDSLLINISLVEHKEHSESLTTLGLRFAIGY